MILLVNATATFFLTGLIWFVQLVHYPLFAAVGAPTFAKFHQKHMRRTTWVVVAPMLIEAVTAVMLVITPVGLSPAESWLGLGLVVAVWLTTFRLQVPQHEQLARGFDFAVVDALVQGNWIRSALWTARAALCAVGLSRLL